MSTTNHISTPRVFRAGLLVAAVLAAGAVLFAFFLFMAELNQDEGWYLHAARLVASSQLPYRDFAFTQSPLFPLVYSLANPLVSHLGLLGGRLFTGLLSLLAALLALRLAVRLSPEGDARNAVLVCLPLLLVNAFQATFSVVVKTYALSSLFLAAAVLALSRVSPKRSLFPAALSALFFSLCAGVRISFALALPAVFLYLFLYRARFRRGAWLVFAAVAAASCALLFLPFWLIAPEPFRFGVFEYHSARAVGSALSAVAYRAGCLSLLLQDYLPAVLVLCGASAALFFLPPPFPFPDPPAAVRPAPLVRFLWLLLGLLALLHLAAPFPYDDYFVPLYPVFAALVTARLLRALTHVVYPFRHPNFFPTAVFLLCLFHVLASPRIQTAFLAGRDRIWWNLRHESPVSQLHRAAQWVRNLSEENNASSLLTQDLYLAVEARLPVPHGLDMGPFSYAPDLPRDRAERLGLLNRDMLADILLSDTNAAVAPLSAYSFAVAVPAIQPVSDEDARLFESLLAEHFELAETIPDFGQAATPLRIFQRIAPTPDEPPAPETDDPDDDLPAPRTPITADALRSVKSAPAADPDPAP